MSYAKNFQTVEEAKPDYAVAGHRVRLVKKQRGNIVTGKQIGRAHV